MNKICLVSQVFHPDEQATSQILSDLMATLTQRGIYCEVLAGFPADRSGASSAPFHEIWHGILIRRGGARLNGKKNLATRALAYASYCLWLLWWLTFRVPNDSRVLVVTNPPFAPILVHWCSLVRGWSYEVMLHDVYPDGLVALGKMRSGAALTRLWRFLNRHALGAARRVWVLGRDMGRLVETRYRVLADRVVYLPNWSPVHPTGEVAAEQTRLWRQLGFRNEFVVQYSGNMGLWHDMESIVRAAEQLRSDRAIKFLMIGEGRRRAAAEKLCHDLGLENMVWLTLQPRAQLEDTLACCHAALISQRAGLEGIAVPSKLYGILASGRPIIVQAPARSEVALVVAEEDCGVVTPPGDAIALAEAIRHLASNRRLASELGRRAFRAYRLKYTVEVAADTFDVALNRAVASAPAKTSIHSP